MLVRTPKWKSYGLYVALFVCGILLEALVYSLATFWAARYSASPLSLGPVMFLASLCFVYGASQVLNALFHIPFVAGMSLTLLSGMISWLGAIALLLFLVLAISMAIYALIGVPVRIVYFAYKSHKT
jgi:hypothetical protein